jgi:hypothetical protein
MLAVVSWQILNLLTPEVSVRYMFSEDIDSADMTYIKKSCGRTGWIGTASQA